MLFKTLYPVGLFFLSYFQARSSFASFYRREQQADDQFWFMNYGKANSVEKFLIRKREQIIFDTIDQQVKKADSPSRIGIIYGAGHMKNVIKYLIEHHSFSIIDSWFLTVFWLSDSLFDYKRKQ